ncbi:restriction endonuclease [Mycoplasma wenyonii str. Massachusetts]|uniref:Restriction endonuclease n=1 Tax=Mycoplasma wenyonii (strain Massachusetts) TaxID=1197325 RepID=I6ZF28_MYCWM|nr:restriction endonuclease PLD domain-containing protein [Mycoplasma wenyonii]AFN65222.1 restriction endonuclease [Mycoplasma wenyonii str. Massachusetts]
MRLTIDGEDNLPSRKNWFYLMTDNGHLFKACFSGRGQQIKWLNAFEKKEIIGEWIKTRLVNWDLIEEYEYASEDYEGYGIITKEILECFGNDKVFLKKTTKTKTDKERIERDVWLISFPYSLVYS